MTKLALCKGIDPHYWGPIIEAPMVYEFMGCGFTSTIIRNDKLGFEIIIIIIIYKKINKHHDPQKLHLH